MLNNMLDMQLRHCFRKGNPKTVETADNLTNNKVVDKITGTESESPPDTVPNKPKYVEIRVKK